MKPAASSFRVQGILIFKMTNCYKKIHSPILFLHVHVPISEFIVTSRTPMIRLNRMSEESGKSAYY